jgi:hypothetical protein
MSTALEISCGQSCTPAPAHGPWPRMLRRIGAPPLNAQHEVDSLARQLWASTSLLRMPLTAPQWQQLIRTLSRSTAPARGSSPDSA